MQNKKTPIRTCISCRETSEKKELVRIVRTPEGEIVLDMTEEFFDNALKELFSD